MRFEHIEIIGNDSYKWVIQGKRNHEVYLYKNGEPSVDSAPHKTWFPNKISREAFNNIISGHIKLIKKEQKKMGGIFNWIKVKVRAHVLALLAEDHHFRFEVVRLLKADLRFELNDPDKKLMGTVTNISKAERVNGAFEGTVFHPNTPIAITPSEAHIKPRGGKKVPISQDRIDEGRRLYAEGKKLVFIARAVNMSPPSLYKYVVPQSKKGQVPDIVYAQPQKHPEQVEIKKSETSLDRDINQQPLDIAKYIEEQKVDYNVTKAISSEDEFKKNLTNPKVKISTRKPPVFKTRGKTTPDKVNTLNSLYTSGKSVAEIAKTLNMSHAWCYLNLEKKVMVNGATHE